jgi:hypothetical protein
MTVQRTAKTNGSHPELAPARAIPEFRLTREALAQDQEWIDINLDGKWQRKRLHDYEELYSIPGLYEAIFNRTLKCSSPVRVVSLLADVMAEAGDSLEDLRVLDLGAGNGMVGHELNNLNVATCIGIDIIPEAREATLRDRPGATTTTSSPTSPTYRRTLPPLYVRTGPTPSPASPPWALATSRRRPSSTPSTCWQRRRTSPSTSRRTSSRTGTNQGSQS